MNTGLTNRNHVEQFSPSFTRLSFFVGHFFLFHLKSSREVHPSSQETKSRAVDHTRTSRSLLNPYQVVHTPLSSLPFSSILFFLAFRASVCITCCTCFHSYFYPCHAEFSLRVSYFVFADRSLLPGNRLS